MAHMEGNLLRDDWYAEDVIQQAAQDGFYVTEIEAIKILGLLVKNFNCEVGINWDVITYATFEFLEGLYGSDIATWPKATANKQRNSV